MSPLSLQTRWAKRVQRWTGSDRLTVWTYKALAVPSLWSYRLRLRIWLALGGRP